MCVCVCVTPSLLLSKHCARVTVGATNTHTYIEPIKVYPIFIYFISSTRARARALKH